MSRLRKPGKPSQTAPPPEAECQPEATPQRVGDPGRTKSQRDQADLTQERFRDLLETAEAIVWEAEGATLGVTFASQGVERILGFSPDEWLRAPDFWANHLHPEDRGWCT
jgi:PAS domain-containing protein